MKASMTWSGWLLCSMGCLICMFSRYSTFRLSVVCMRVHLDIGY